MNEQIFAFLPQPSHPDPNSMLPMAKSLFYSEGQDDQFLFERNYDLTENIFPDPEPSQNENPFPEPSQNQKSLRPCNHSFSLDGDNFVRQLQKEQEEQEEIEEEEQQKEYFNSEISFLKNAKEDQNKLYNNINLGQNEEDQLDVLLLNKEISYKSLDYEALDLELLKQKSKFSQISQTTHQKIIKKHKSLKIKEKNEEKKNIHRYMIRQVIRSLTSEDFKPKVVQLCQKHECEYDLVKQSYLGQIENFTSIQLLSEHWSINPNDDSIENKNRMVFKEFSKWFLKERAIRYILNGKMKDPMKYIRYKNHIMLYYVDRPQEYKSNNKKI